MKNALAGFSTDALLAEIVRRRNDDVQREPVEHWCEDCAHFRFSTSERDTANNCTKGHVMQFQVPEDFPDEEYGFFRRVCPDRADRPPEPPPPRCPPRSVGGKKPSKSVVAGRY